MQDRKVVLAVIGSTLVLGVLAVAGGIFLAWSRGVALDAALVGIAGTALGVLGTLLASTKTTPDEPTSVQIDQPAGDPVPVAETPKRR